MLNSSSESINCADLVAENTHAINQLTDFLVALPAQVYRQTFGARKQHVIGKHVRHIIDHYMALLRTVDEPSPESLDYENRQREESLELDQHAACNRLLAIVSSLCQLMTARHRTSVLMRHVSDDHDRLVSTSIDRELVFLASHTVHHMAIIAMLAEQEGVEVSEEFGVHPSTLRHLQQLNMAKSA